MSGGPMLTGLRVLWRHRSFLALNVLGLTIGMSTAFAIFVHVHQQWSFDRWIPEHRHIVRVEGATTAPGREPIASARAPGIVLPFLQQDLPGVEAAARAVQRQVLLQHADKRVMVQALVVDPSFLRVFKLPMAPGSSAAPLADAASVVLDADTARRLFGAQPPLDRTLTAQLGARAVPLRVTALIADFPGPTHLAIQALIPLQEAYFTQEPWILNEWFSNSAFTYLKLAAPTETKALDEALAQLLARRLPRQGERPGETADGTALTLKARPVTDIQLHSAARQELKPPGSFRSVVLLVVIALVSLVVAALNYVNLSLAMALARAREAALRAIFGATRSALAAQALQESLALALTSAAIAAVLTALAWPAYDAMLGGGVSMSMAVVQQLGLYAGVVGVVLGLCAGVLPALRFASAGHGSSLFMQARAPAAASALREGLILLQFATAATLLICTFVAYAQTRHLLRMDLGFAPDRLVNLNAANPGQPRALPEPLLNELRRLPGVRAVTSALVVPGATYGWPVGVQRGGDASSAKTAASLELGFIDFDYFDVLGIPVVAGRALSRDHVLDDVSQLGSAALVSRGANVVIDVVAARALGFANPGDAVGQPLTVDHWVDEVRLPATIVGVVAAHRLRPSVTEAMPARIFFREASWATNVVLRLAADAPADTDEALRRVWDRHLADEPFRLEPAASAYASLAQGYLQLTRVYAFSAVVTIVIACLGMYGLVAYAVQQRAREIAIRGILGAGPLRLFASIGARLLRPTLLAVVIAAPLGSYLMARWLSSFVSHVAVSAWHVGAAVLLTLATALAVTSLNLLRAVRRSPADILRHE